LLRPRRGAELLEHRAGLGESLCRQSALPEPTMQASFDQPGRGELERQPRRNAEIKLIQRAQCRCCVARRGEDKRPGTGKCDVDPCSRDRPPALLKPGEHLTGTVELPKSDQRLDAERVGTAEQAVLDADPVKQITQ